MNLTIMVTKGYSSLALIDDIAKGGLTILFTVIPCAPKHLKDQLHRYLKTFGSQIETEGSLEIEESIL